jgi:hypothetical protein
MKPNRRPSAAGFLCAIKTTLEIEHVFKLGITVSDVYFEPSDPSCNGLTGFTIV